MNQSQITAPLMSLHRSFFVLLLVTVLFLPGCEIIGNIFQAGFFTALFLIALVVAVAAFIIYKMRD